MKLNPILYYFNLIFIYIQHTYSVNNNIFYSHGSLRPLDNFEYPEYTHFLFNSRPIIGILTQPTCWPKIYHPSQYSYIASSYVKFIEQSGARVVKIKYDLRKLNLSYYLLYIPHPTALLGTQSEENLTQILSHINGLVIPGGSSDLFIDGYDSELTKFANTAQFLINQVIQINDQGEYFPIWGSSLGFESLVVTISNQSKIIEQFNSTNFSQTLKFNKAAITSKLYSKMPYQMKRYLNDNKGLFFNHKTGISIDKFISNEKLRNFFDILSVSQDKNGQTFISSIEAKEYPIYGSQFQPEKNAFEWKENLQIDHSPESIQIQQYFSEFFVNECRKNARSYDNPKEEKKDLIYNYYPVQLSESFVSIYVFSAPQQKELNYINKKKIIQQQIQLKNNKTLQNLNKTRLADTLSNQSLLNGTNITTNQTDNITNNATNVNNSIGQSNQAKEPQLIPSNSSDKNQSQSQQQHQNANKDTHSEEHKTNHKFQQMSSSTLNSTKQNQPNPNKLYVLKDFITGSRKKQVQQ